MSRQSGDAGAGLAYIRQPQFSQSPLTTIARIFMVQAMVFRVVCTTSKRPLNLRPLSSLSSALATRRCISTSSPLYNARPGLQSKGINESADKGAEGLHRADTATVRSVKHDIPTHSDVPVVMGDWVLFHPVYSSEELKNVKACDFLYTFLVTAF